MQADALNYHYRVNVGGVPRARRGLTAWPHPTPNHAQRSIANAVQLEARVPDAVWAPGSLVGCWTLRVAGVCEGCWQGAAGKISLGENNGHVYAGRTMLHMSHVLVMYGFRKVQREQDHCLMVPSVDAVSTAGVGARPAAGVP